jgi:regulator of sigma E protease
MIAVNILIGLVGLGLVIFIHEFGHLVGAKSVGIEVEAFSLGWGKKLIGRTWRGTEYRISVFPVGGYCKMKGERSYTAALESNQETIPHEPGSFFAASAWRRLVALFAGPAANFLFAVVVMSIVWWIGFTVETLPNRIILASEYGVGDDTSPADSAGLETGDIIVEMGGRQVTSYADIEEIVAQNALTPLRTVVDRDGTLMTVTLTPDLRTESGAGVIGVYAYVEPLVVEVQAGSPAAEAGFQSGDLIVSANGNPVPHTLEFSRLIDQSTEASVTVDVERDGDLVSLEVTPSSDGTVGIAFATISVPTPDLNVFQAIGRGTAESFRTLVFSIRSLRLMFQGVRLRSAVAGPVRISYFIGDVATSGFSIGFREGLRSVATFLALLSVILFFMNLLPIPLLDGGQIVLVLIESLRRRPPSPRFIYRYQLVGSVIVVATLFFALFGDILFLAGR